MKPLKILYIIETLEVYGAERSLVALAKEFQHIIPVFVHLYPGSPLKKELIENGIKVYSLNLQGKNDFNKARKLLKKIYLSEKPDIVHSTLFRADLVARKMKADFSNIPLISSWVTNSYSKIRYKNKTFLTQIKLWRAFLLDKFSAHKVDRFLANSYTIEKTNRIALKVPEGKTSVIYRGRKIDHFTEVSEERKEFIRNELNLKNKRVLLNVGRLIPTKGHLELLQIMPGMIKSFPDIVLLVCGEGKYRKVLEEEIKNQNLESYVQLLGSRNNIPELLAVAEYFVFPSHLEGLSGSLIEAMLAGKIIIASDIKENLECVSDTTALLYKAGDKTDLLLRISEALQKPEFYKFKGREACEVAKKKFDIRVIAKKYEDFYRSVL